MAQEGERGSLLRRREAVPDLWAQLEHIQQVGRDRCGLDFARVSGARQVVALRPDGRDSGEVLRQRAQVVEVRERHAEPHASEPGEHDLDEPVRSGVRQRLEQHGVDRAEDGRVGTGAEREGEHSDQREAGALGEGADGVAQVLEERVHHSYLRATIGSTCAARRAGSQQASRATPANTAATPAKVSGSVALTPNSRLVITRVSINAPATPASTPAPTTPIPWLTTIRSTSWARAPSAMRRPISRVRCATECASTP